ncbi:unnamed protein product [Agarophyton chilense]|eukprot:gb/GEZJ01000380.1/.p1 GENE.gb/GEZJ01000380.1/~~gb/GEZJ01000380.1/.p1  ORF type:complete len:177 (-),score=5.11 gb/GEZJ01000380.1/:646-1176(-)
MRTIIHLVSLVTLLAAANASGRPRRPDACERAFYNCAFRFQGSNNLQTFSLGVPDTPFTPQIVSSNRRERIGILNSNGVEPQFINSHGVATAITFFGNRFTPTQFKPFAIQQRIGSGIGHETFQGDASLAKNKCVRVYFTSYQRLQSIYPPVVVTNVNLSPHDAIRMRACVVFRTA